MQFSPTLSAREHAHLARTLVSACGGLEEASTHCRVSKSKLSDYGNPHVGLFMPADVMADLEGYCGLPIYSREIFKRTDRVNVAGSLMAAACDLTEGVATLQSKIRAALADGELSNNELNEITAVERETEAMLDRVRGARRAIETAREA